MGEKGNDLSGAGASDPRYGYSPATGALSDPSSSATGVPGDSGAEDKGAESGGDGAEVRQVGDGGGDLSMAKDDPGRSQDGGSLGGVMGNPP